MKNTNWNFEFCFLILILLFGFAFYFSTSIYPNKNSEIKIEETKSEIEIPNEESEIEVEIKNVEPEPEPEDYYQLSDNERYIVECMVAGEAGAEGIQEMRLVAQTILQNCIDENELPSVIRKTYSYSGWKEINSMPEDVQASVKSAVDSIFVNGDMAVDAPIKVFYNSNLMYSSWHEAQVFICETESGTRFFTY